MKHKLLMIVSGLFVVAALAFLILFMQIDSLVKSAIEKYGSQITGVSVSVGKVDLSPSSGEGSVSNLVIGNPKGYSAKDALTMQTTSVTVDSKTVTTDIVVIDEIVMDGPFITYEVTAQGSNFKTIRQNINDYMSKGGKSAVSGEIAQKQVIVKDLYIRNGKINVSAPIVGNKTYDVKLPTIHLTNLGKNGGKGNLPDVIQQVMTVITGTVLTAVGPVTIENIGGFFTGGATSVVGGAINSVDTAVEGIFGGSPQK
jgi:hypothetical protein